MNVFRFTRLPHFVRETITMNGEKKSLNMAAMHINPIYVQTFFAAFPADEYFIFSGSFAVSNAFLWRKKPLLFPLTVYVVVAITVTLSS